MKLKCIIYTRDTRCPTLYLSDWVVSSLTTASPARLMLFSKLLNKIRSLLLSRCSQL